MRKRPLSLKVAFSLLSVRALPVPETKIFFTKPLNGPILIFWNLILYTFLCTKSKKITMEHFFLLMPVLVPCEMHSRPRHLVLEIINKLRGNQNISQSQHNLPRYNLNLSYYYWSICRREIKLFLLGLFIYHVGKKIQLTSLL